MPTYVYETIPAKKGGPRSDTNFKQSIKDAAFTKHPETGEPIKRIVTGGIGVLTSSSAVPVTLMLTDLPADAEPEAATAERL